MPTLGNEFGHTMVELCAGARGRQWQQPTLPAPERDRAARSTAAHRAHTRRYRKLLLTFFN